MKAHRPLYVAILWNVERNIEGSGRSQHQSQGNAGGGGDAPSFPGYDLSYRRILVATIYKSESTDHVKSRVRGSSIL